MTKHFSKRILLIGLLLAIVAGGCVPGARAPTRSPATQPALSPTSTKTTPPPPPTKTPAPSATPTLPPTPTLTIQPSKLTFAVIGDYGLAGPGEKEVAQLVKSWDPAIIITTGDNNYPQGSGKTIDENVGQYFHSFIHPYQGSYGEGAEKNRFFPTLGNHDWRWPEPDPYLEYFSLPGNERYYDFVWGPVHFFALNSVVHEPDGVAAKTKQGQWLKKGLQESLSPWKIVYMHHAPFTSGAHGPTEWMQWPYQEWGASAVIAGHDHTYERLEINGLPYFVNGLGGNGSYDFEHILPESKVRYRADYGAMKVTASRERITFKFITRAGKVIDSYTMER